MDLNTLWFALIAVLFIGFFILEGFDFGVGILLPFLGKNDNQRRVIINSIGPFWDGNEVWIITAGGAMFAAFPHWYATLFSGFYLALFLMLLGIILRAVAFEFRSKNSDPKWRGSWDWAIFTGSFIPALLWGVAFANLMRGVPIDQSMNYVGGFWNLLNPFALLGGLVTLGIFTLHGAIFLNLKIEGDIADRALEIAKKLWLPVLIVFIAFIVWTYVETDILSNFGVNPGVIPILAFISLIVVRTFLQRKLAGWAFISTTLTIMLTIATIFMGLFPRVMISSINPEWSMTIYSASSSHYTLMIMSIVALIFTPIVLIYQGWTYWVFKKRISEKSEMEY